MKLKEINKARYRKHLNIVIAILIVSLMALALLFGQAFIALFADAGGDNFKFNLAGVVVAGLICLKGLHGFKDHDFMVEVYYVWQLKQSLNKIFRKLKKIEEARDSNEDSKRNVMALTILTYYYAASEQLFKLDDNTITLDSLSLASQTLQEKILAANLEINVADYEQSLLSDF